MFPSTEIDEWAQSPAPTAVEDKEYSKDLELTVTSTGCCSLGSHTHQAISQPMADIDSIFAESEPLLLSQQYSPAQRNPIDTSPSIVTYSQSYEANLSAIEHPGQDGYLPGMASTEFQYDHNIPASHPLVPPQTLLQEPYSTLWSYENMNLSGGNQTACLCGEACECLGCPIHPFNDTTKNEVRELNDILEADMAAEYAAQNLPNQTDSSSLTSPVEVSPGFQDYRRGSNLQYDYDHQYPRPPSSHTGTANLSVLPEYNSYQFVFKYCMGQADTCLCGPGCACPGCVTHNNARGYQHPGGQDPGMMTSTHPPHPMTMDPNSYASPNMATNPLHPQYRNQYQPEHHHGFKSPAEYPNLNRPPHPPDILDPANDPYHQHFLHQ